MQPLVVVFLERRSSDTCPGTIRPALNVANVEVKERCVEAEAREPEFDGLTKQFDAIPWSDRPTNISSKASKMRRGFGTTNSSVVFDTTRTRMEDQREVAAVAETI